jgi:spermidine synthase
MGKVLILDGCFMVTERDTFIYHEMLTHPAMNTAVNPKRVLVIGGGDGGTVTEIVKYPSVESVVLCEIDAMVVEQCRRFFPELSAGLDDPRVSVVNLDGAAYTAEHKNAFDVILVDSTDPVGPGCALYEPSFYHAIREALTDTGVVGLQTESPLFMQDVFTETVAKLRNEFSPENTATALAVIPSYPGSMWSFTFCSPTRNAAQGPSVLPSALDGRLRYYSPEMHRAAFTLPVFVKALLKA